MEFLPLRLRKTNTITRERVEFRLKVNLIKTRRVIKTKVLPVFYTNQEKGYQDVDNNTRNSSASFPKVDRLLNFTSNILNGKTVFIPFSGIFCRLERSVPRERISCLPFSFSSDSFLSCFYIFATNLNSSLRE